MKQLSEYTPQELQNIGKKTVEARIKEVSRNKEKNTVLSALYKAYKEGKVKLPTKI